MGNADVIMVLVTLQRHCARLIRMGTDMALKEGCLLKVVHVAEVTDEDEKQRVISAKVLNDLYALANEAGAEMCVLTSSVMVTAVAEYAANQNVKQIIIGDGSRATGIAETLSEMLPGTKILIARATEN